MRTILALCLNLFQCVNKMIKREQLVLSQVQRRQHSEAAAAAAGAS